MAGFERLLVYIQRLFNGRSVGEGIAANRHIGLDGGEQFPAHAAAFDVAHCDNQHHNADGNGDFFDAGMDAGLLWVRIEFEGTNQGIEGLTSVYD